MHQQGQLEFADLLRLDEVDLVAEPIKESRFEEEPISPISPAQVALIGLNEPSETRKE